MGALIDLSGKQFGKWTVIRRSESTRCGRTRFECKCSCGVIKYVLSCHLISGKSTHCGTCIRFGPSHQQWKGYGEISADFWQSIQRGASGAKGRRTKIEFNITIEYIWNLFLEQERRCALSGIGLVMLGTRRRRLRTASLDRIDNSVGYIVGNVQWVHKDINRMKGTLDQEYFMDLIRKIANHAQ